MKPTLIEFLENTQSKIYVFDMGRRIQSITRDDFLEFEKTNLPYPYPLKQQAWLGICIQSLNTTDEPVIWFLKLPLDEQGKLVQASRDYFLHRLLEAVAEDLATTEKMTSEDLFKDNPFVFKPREDRMAVFHAQLAKTMQQESSRFYDHALAYFSGTHGWEQWSFVGYQGIAELAINSTDAELSASLASSISHLPAQPLVALCHCLENTPILPNLSDTLIKRLQNELLTEEPAAEIVSALIRGLSFSQSQHDIEQVYLEVLESNLASHIEILAAVSGRAWQTLGNNAVAQTYLEALAQNDAGEQGFNECIRDLFSLPGLRVPLLGVLTASNVSKKLQQRFQDFTASLGQASQ